MIIQGTAIIGTTVSSSAATVAADSYFNLVSLLLPGNGTNGAQNNTFVDSSTNNFTITRNGNTTQGTFSPFSQTGWSNYFDGSGDYLSTGLNAAFDFGSGAFTIEGWVNISSFPAGGAVTYGLTTLYATGDSDVGTDVRVLVSKGSTLGGYSDGVIFASNSTVIAQSGSFTFNAYQWYHIAVTRSSNSIYIFIDGVLKSTTSYSSTLPTATTYGPSIGATLYRGSPLYLITGYISNVRVLKGTAQYTATFTPSTTPLTAIANTSLLTCQSNRFVDNSTNAFAITVNGNTSIQAFSPFDPVTAYSTTTVGGSGYFDGTGDYLTLTGNSSFAFGTGDFTLEAWVYITANQVQYASILANSSNPDGWFLSFGTSNFVNFSNFNVVALTSSSAVPLNAWTHIAVARSGTSLKMFFNGVQVASATNSTSYGVAATTYIGFNGTSHLINGYVTDARVIKGTAVYTSAFTPPTAPLTAISGTSLLLNYTNAGITDAAAKNVIETVGNAQISTAQSKFGGSSLFFDGNADALLAPSIPINALGTGDFTIETWIRWSFVPNSGATYAYFFAIGGNTVNGMGLYVQNGKIKLWNTAEILAGSTTLSADTWYHVALVRSSGTVKLYLNGTQDGTVSMSSNLTGGVLNLGHWYNISDLNYFSGYMDDFRITKGLARYTTNFTPPTTAFPVQ